MDRCLRAYNKRFKRDSQRVAFFYALVFVITMLCGSLAVALAAP
ncbi:hypothetical protein VCSRO83_3624 [Vibrio cholerae]|nr:hypothetical protein VCSRO83_3624 [Vibrio cholerae]